MQAVQIIKHAVNMLTADTNMTFKVLLLPIILSVVVAMIAGAMLLGGPLAWFDQSAMEARMATGNMNWGGFVLVLILSAVFWLWGAVAWHRYVLLDETPTGFMPKFHGGRMLAYFGWAIVISLVIAVIAIVFGLITAALSVLGSFGIFLGTAIMMVAIFIFWLGLSSILPGVASAKPVSFGDAFSKIFENIGMLFVLAIVLAVLSLVPLGIVELTGSTFLIAIMNIIVQLVVGAIILSTMTTLYGMWYEGRALD